MVLKRAVILQNLKSDGAKWKKRYSQDLVKQTVDT